MTPSETDESKLRVKLAELLGYEKQTRSDMFWHRGLGKYFAPFELPDYCNDLNACHEAEKTLTPDQGIVFRFLLARNSDGRDATFKTVEAAMCHATALQRTRALIATLEPQPQPNEAKV